MRNPAIMLLWEQFRQTWIFWTLGALALWAFGAGADEAYYEETLEAAFPLTVTLITLCFLFMQGSYRDMRPATPRRLYSLPVSTRYLFVTLSAYRVAVMLLFGLFLGWVQDRYLPRAMLPPSWVYPLVLPPMTLWVQALIALIGAYGIYRGPARWALQSVPIMAAAAIIMAQPIVSKVYAGILLSLLFAAWCFITGYAAFRDARHAAASPQGVNFRFLHVRRRMDIRLPLGPFKQYLTLFPPDFRAQFYFDWRAYMAWLPRLTAIVLSLLLAMKGMLLMVHSFRQWYMNAYFEFEDSFIMLFPCCIAFGVGFYALRSPKHYLDFCCTRPIPFKTQVRAKLAAGALATAATAALTSAALCVNTLFFSAETPWLGAGAVLLVLVSTWAMLFTGRLLLFAGLTLLALSITLELILMESLDKDVVYLNLWAPVIMGVMTATAWAVIRHRHGEAWISRRVLEHMLLLFFPAALGAAIIQTFMADPIDLVYIGFFVLPLAALYGHAWRNKALSSSALCLIVCAHLAMLVVAWLFVNPGTDTEFLLLGLMSACLAFAWAPLALQRRRVT